MSSKTRLLDCIHPKSDLVTMVSPSQLANVYLPRLVLTKKKKKQRILYLILKKNKISC